MAGMNISSSITFLYFDDLNAAKKFFQETLGLEVVYDPGWASVYRLKDKSFIGAVDNASGSIKVAERGGVLISLTVKDIGEAYTRISRADVRELTPVKQVADIALKSFLFTGPEGYKFEVQQFTSEELTKLF